MWKPIFCGVMVLLYFAGGSLASPLAQEADIDPTSETVIEGPSSSPVVMEESVRSDNEEVKGNSDIQIAERGRTTVMTPEGEVTYDYRDINGLAVAEGDIILGPIEEFKQSGDEVVRSRGLIAPRQMGRDWPNGVVPYVIDSSNRSLVLQAIEEYHKKTSLRFVSRTTHNDYIRFVNQVSWLTSMSELGRRGGAQEVKLNFINRGTGKPHSDKKMKAIIVHETGHALGLDHEHKRSDRDTYLRFDYNCEWDDRFFYEISGNLSKAQDLQRVGSYDFNSIMHYVSPAGTNKDTGEQCFYYVRRDNGKDIPYNLELSAGDIQTLARRYGAFRTSSLTTAAGGSGGTAYRLDCPSNRVLVGIRGRAGSLIDGIRGVCAKVSYNGNWSGGTTNTTYRGGSGGTAFSRVCPSGYAVSGISGRKGSLVDRIRLYCRKLVNASDAGLKHAGRLTGSRTGLSSIGGGGGSAFGRYDCVDNMPGRGLRVRSGRYLNRIQVYCRVGSVLPSTLTLSRPKNHANLGGTRRPQFQYSGGYKATKRTVMICPANANSGYCRAGASNTISFTAGETADRVPQDLAAGQYKWHVTASNGVGQTRSAIRLFSIGPGPRVVMVQAGSGKFCRGASTGNNLTAKILNDGLGGTAQRVKVSLYWTAFRPEIGFIPSGGALKTVDIGGLRKNQSKTATFSNIALPATRRSVDVLLMKTSYPDGLYQNKQAIINVGRNLDTYRNCQTRGASSR